MRNWILKDHCDDSLIEAIERNIIERTIYFPSRHPKMDVIVEDDLILMDSKTNLSQLNAICTTKFIPEDVLARVKKATDYFRDKKQAFMWIVGPTTPVETLYDALKTCGLHKSTRMPALVLNMTTFRTRPKYIPGFRIQHVLVPTALQDFAKVLGSFINLKDDLEAYFEKISHLALHSSDPIRLFVGYLYDVPVIVGELYLGAGLAGFNTIVDKSQSALARDFVTDMTTKMVLMAKEQGYHFAITTAKQEALPLYLGLGFKKHCDFFLFNEAHV